MIQDTGWQSLQTQWTNAKLIMVYIIVYGLVNLPANSFFHSTALNTQKHRVYTETSFQLNFQTVFKLLSAFFVLWNSLPDNFRTAVDFNKLKYFMLH